jgi:hypothetical protein
MLIMVDIIICMPLRLQEVAGKIAAEPPISLTASVLPFRAATRSLRGAFRATRALLKEGLVTMM